MWHSWWHSWPGLTVHSPPGVTIAGIDQAEWAERGRVLSTHNCQAETHSSCRPHEHPHLFFSVDAGGPVVKASVVVELMPPLEGAVVGAGLSKPVLPTKHTATEAPATKSAVAEQRAVAGSKRQYRRWYHIFTTCFWPCSI